MKALLAVGIVVAAAMVVAAAILVAALSLPLLAAPVSRSSRSSGHDGPRYHLRPTRQLRPGEVWHISVPLGRTPSGLKHGAAQQN